MKATLGQNLWQTSPQPTKTSDWDKFMQFNNAVMPVIGNILGTWMQGRAQAQSAKTMADALASMPAEDRQKVMQQYMVQKMLLEQGYSPQQLGVSQSNMQNMGQAWNMLPGGQTQSAANGAFAFLQGGMGGNTQMQAMLNRQGAQFGVTGLGSLAKYAIPVLIAGTVVAGVIFLPKIMEKY
jgi:hypothetical protein